jgi:hypothetical protein
MPRLGVPSTTDSAPRPNRTYGEPAPYRGRQIPGTTIDLAALSGGFFNPLLNRRKRDERKALGAALPGKMRPFQGDRRAHPRRLGRNNPKNSFWPAGERSTPREVIDATKFCGDGSKPRATCGAPAPFSARRGTRRKKGRDDGLCLADPRDLACSARRRFPKINRIALNRRELAGA